MGGKVKKTEKRRDRGTEDFSRGEQPGMGLPTTLHLLLPVLFLTGEGGRLLRFRWTW